VINIGKNGNHDPGLAERVHELSGLIPDQARGLRRRGESIRGYAAARPDSRVSKGSSVTRRSSLTVLTQVIDYFEEAWAYTEISP
jgi:hypothetical protein